VDFHAARAAPHSLRPDLTAAVEPVFKRVKFLGHIHYSTGICFSAEAVVY
jgi:hypothetical protein